MREKKKQFAGTLRTKTKKNVVLIGYLYKLPIFSISSQFTSRTNFFG